MKIKLTQLVSQSKKASPDECRLLKIQKSSSEAEIKHHSKQYFDRKSTKRDCGQH